MKAQNRLFYLLFTLLSSLCLSACAERVETEDYFFEIKDEALKADFKETQSSQIIPVRTNLDNGEWRVSSDQSWCLATKESSGIKILVLPSEEADVRTATVLVKSSMNEYTISVRQLGYGPAILIKEPSVTVEALGGDFSIEVTSNIEYTVTRSAQSDWIVDKPTSRGFTTQTNTYSVSANLSFESRTAVFNYAGKDNPDVSANCKVTQIGKKTGLSDVVIEGDLQIVPIGGKDNQHHAGNDITKSFDGKKGAGTEPYHSPWQKPYDDPTTEFPVVLEYFFDGTKDLDYLVYHTRSGNGNFGQLDLYLSTQSTPEYTFYKSYDFMEQNSSSRIDFDQKIEKVKQVKFVVKSGLNGFVSCDEMEFFQANLSKVLENKLLTVFQDVTCTALKAGVTSEQINALPGYFAHIAIQLKDGTYDSWEKEFRVRSYAPYSIETEWADKLMTKKYSNLDNPTGIYVESGDSIVVLVGETHGQKIKINCIGEETTGFGETKTYVQTEANGEQYYLKEGVNKIGFHKKGMLFIMYNADLSLPTAQPIKIHIPLGSGNVSGFFDLKEHKTNDKYQELIDKSTYKYFCVRGDKIIFYFHKDKMKEAVPYDILSAINLWDDIVGWEQELMGIENVRPQFVNNHLFAMSPEGSYMWASDYRIAFVYTYLKNILLKENVMAAKDNAWGPAHEIGHIHQKAINWPGSSESSNNLFSNYILYKLGKYCSRGSELKSLAEARFVNGQAWCNMGSATHQNEDTEVHMRMNWQLWNYYHRCGYKANFWQTLFKLMRENRIDESNPGAGQLLFAKMASKAANEDLTDFFEMWGFFVPVDMTIEQYGTFRYLVTDQMINEAKNYMAQFPKAKHAFYYLEDRKRGDVGLDITPPDVGYYSQFKNNQKITKTVTCTQSGQRVTIQNGDEAVAFEIKRGDRLVYFANMYSFDVPMSIDLTTTQIYAVQADGTRVLVQKK